MDDVVLTYNALNKPLPIVLEDLTIFSKVNIVFSESKISKNRRVTIHANKERLGSILSVILSPYNLDYEVVGENIVIIDKRAKDYGELYNVRGKIRDKNSHEILPFASIYALDRSWGVDANEHGFFSINIRKGERKICVSYIGYKTDTIRDYFSEGKDLDIFLTPNSLLNEVIIKEDRNQLYVTPSNVQFSKFSLTEGNFFGGESDIMHRLAASSGVTSGADGFGGLNVRGGSNDQNLVLLDGVPLQQIGHGFGVLSIFNSSAIQDARLYKSGFPARFGGKLSSVLDIYTREGNKNKYSGEITLSTIAAHGTVEGPLFSNKSSFILSFRRTHADPWIKLITKAQNNQNQGLEGESSYKFYDINGKFSFDLNPKNHLTINLYKGHDNFNSYKNFKSIFSNPIYITENRSGINWGNTLYSLSLKSQVGNRAFSNLLIYNTDWVFEENKFNRYSTDSITSFTDIFSSFYKLSKINSKAITWDLDYQINNKHRARLGLGALKQNYHPSYSNISNRDTSINYPEQITVDDLKQQLSSVTTKPLEFNLHAEDYIDFGGGFTVTGGLHLSLYKVDSTIRTSYQPRIKVEQKGDYVLFELSASRMRQYGQVLSEEGLGFPSDLWITSTSKIRPADGWIYSTGLLTQFGNGYVLGGELYYKSMTNIIVLNEGQAVNLEEPLGWDRFIPRGNGDAYGFDFDFSKQSGKTNFNFNYSYLKSNRKFLDINNANQFPHSFQRDHSFNLHIKQAFSSNVELVINGAYYTGRPITYPNADIVEVTNSSGEHVLQIVYEAKNNARLPNYSRVDVGFNFYNKYDWGRQKVFLGLYNVFNTKNPVYINVDRNDLNPQYYEVEKVNIIPILPVIYYSITI